MSIHPSLRISIDSRKQRSVLKRGERIKHFMAKGSFNEQSPVFGLPKIKTLKIKVVKKEKAEAVPVAGAPASGASQPAAKAPAAKPASKAKG